MIKNARNEKEEGEKGDGNKEREKGEKNKEREKGENNRERENEKNKITRRDGLRVRVMCVRTLRPAVPFRRS